MSSPPSQASTLNSRFWARSECERKSGNYAAALTFGLMAVLYAALLPPFGSGAAVPKGDSLHAGGPLAVELRRVQPSAPVWEEAKPAPGEEARKLLSDEARPDSLVVAEPPAPKKITPVAEKEPDPVPVKKPKPLQRKKTATPSPVKAPAQAAPDENTSPERAETLTGSPHGVLGGSPEGVPGGVPGGTLGGVPGGGPGGGKFGHPSGREGVAPDTNGKILTVLLHAVEKNKRYPLQARRLGQQGRVTLRVTIDARGRVSACALTKKSGIASLDKATEKLGESLIGLDIPPARGKAVEVLIPVQYALKH